MKVLNHCIIAILVFSIPAISMADAFAQNDTSYPPLNDLGDGNVFSIVVHDLFQPGQTVEITGNLLTVNPILIALDDPDAKMVSSKTTFSDRNGYFTSELKIPSDAESGIWKIVGTSGIYHKELNFTIAGNSYTATCYAGDLCSKPIVNSTVQYGKSSVSTGIKSPLEQFKSGIKPEYVKCNHDLFLIIKAEDGSYACVTIETGKNLAMRGWAHTFGTGISTADYYTKCDTLYPQSDAGVAVMYMPTNSIGKICVRYYNVNNTPTGVGMRIFEANNLTQNAYNVTAWTYDSTLEGNANKTIVYFIKTGNTPGFYGASLNCGGFPLAVGYDANSTITASDFPWVGKVFHCGVITYDSKIEGTSGIGIKYIPYP